MTSDAFDAAFVVSAALCYAICHCGRTYYLEGEGDWEEGELEALIERTPEGKLFDWSGMHSAISEVQIDKKVFVVGCECGTLDRYEEFISAHSFQIASYLELKATQRLERTKYEYERVKVAEEALRKSSKWQEALECARVDLERLGYTKTDP